MASDDKEAMLQRVLKSVDRHLTAEKYYDALQVAQSLITRYPIHIILNNFVQN